MLKNKAANKVDRIKVYNASILSSIDNSVQVITNECNEIIS